MPRQSTGIPELATINVRIHRIDIAGMMEDLARALNICRPSANDAYRVIGTAAILGFVYCGHCHNRGY